MLRCFVLTLTTEGNEVSFNESSDAPTDDWSAWEQELNQKQSLSERFWATQNPSYAQLVVMLLCAPVVALVFAPLELAWLRIKPAE
jgi:hypothetical protein